MNNSPQRYQVVNLLDLLWYLCYHWRSLIVGMLLCALLASGFRVYKNDAYNAGVEAQLAAQESPEVEVSIYDTLTQVEAAAVDNAVIYAQQLQQYLNYQKNSVYINLDPYNENVQILNYIVEVKKGDIAEEGMDANALADLLKQSYVGYINSGAAAGAVKAIDADMDQSAIDELISAVDLTNLPDSSSFQTGSFATSGGTTTFNVESDSNIERVYAVFEVTVLGSSEADAKKLADALDQTLNNYTATLTEALDVHTLTLSATNTSVIVDNNLVGIRQSFNTNLINARTNLNNLLAAFTDNQRMAYENITGYRADANTLTDTEAAETVVPEKLPLTSGLAKYLILGLILGIFLWAVVWAMIYILVPTLKTTDDITRCFQYYLMADLSCYQNSNKRFGAGLDKFLGKLRYRDALPLEEEQRLLATNLKVTCRKEEVSSVYLTSSYVMSDAEMQRIDALIESLGKENITAVYGRSVERDAESYEKMTEVGAVVYIERLGKSRFDSLEKISAMTEKQGVKILGVVVM